MNSISTVDKENMDLFFEDLMIEYGDSVIKIAYSYVKDKQLAEDLAQDSFLKAYKSLNNFKGNSSIKTWLYKITTNHCKDYLRSWAHKKVKVVEFINNYLVSSESAPEHIIISQDESKELLHAIFTLPAKYREIIILYYYQELNLKEISEILDLNLNTLKSRLRKSKALLKLQVKREDYKDDIG